MTVREYIGARYVPLFMGDWNVDADYEPLSIVQYQGNSYTSRQAVPHGVEITNTAYWALTGNYNAQVEAYRQEVLQYDRRISAVENGLPVSDFDSENTVSDAIENIEANYLEKSKVYTLQNFTGETDEDKLANALSTIDYGVIVCPEMTITKEITLAAKNYQNVIILGGTFNMQYSKWINCENSLYNTVPAFSNCSFHYNKDVAVSSSDYNVYIFDDGANVVCTSFTNCTFSRVALFADNTKYVQSITATNCRFWGVKNLITAYRIYHGGFINCLIEACDEGVFIDVSNTTEGKNIETLAFRQCTIEGRGEYFIKFRESMGLVIDGCYIEGNKQALVKQTYANASYTQLTFTNNLLLFDTFLDTNNNPVPYVIEYAVTFTRELYLYENELISAASGQYLTNINPFGTFAILNTINEIHGSSMRNNGLNTSKRTRFVNTEPSIPKWNAADSTWDIEFVDEGTDRSCDLARPIYLFFVGSYGGSGDYRGVAIVRIDRYSRYFGGSPVEGMQISATVLHSMNTDNGDPSSSTVSVEASLSTGQDIAATNPKIKIKVSGFNQWWAKYKIIDPFYIPQQYFELMDSEI